MDFALLAGKTIALVVVAGVVLSKSFGSWLRETIIIPKYFISKDIPNLGQVRRGGRLPGQAVVCGGSIAGILAAAVLSDHYEKVLIVEPEAWVSTEDGITLQHKRETRFNETGGHPDLINKRTRVMQSTSIHAYLAGLSPILFQLFPNFTREVHELGLSSRLGNSFLNPHISGVPNPPRPPGFQNVQTIYVSRTTFERLLRRCLFKSRANVNQIVGTVTGVVRSPEDPNLLHQITIRVPDGSEVTKSARVVVDATGSAQVGVKWLQRIGLQLPPSMRVKYTPNVDYTTMSFVVPPLLQSKLPIPGGWNSHQFIYWYVPNTDVETISIIIYVQENNLLTFWFGGWDVESPPKSIPEFKTLIGALRGAHPIPQYVFDMLDILQTHINEIDPAFVLKKLPSPAYTHYHEFAKKAGFPTNFVATGDAVMVVNPFFGQGCTKAGIGAVTLDHQLRSSNPSADRNFSAKFFKLQADRLGNVWAMNKDTDYKFKSTIPAEGETHASGAFGWWFVRQMFKMVRNDPELYWTMWDVNYFLLPATDLMTPGILARAVWTWLTT